MHTPPRHPISAPVGAALGALAPAEAARWAALLAQPTGAMAPVERRARLALRIALLQRAMQPVTGAPEPPAPAAEDAQADAPPAAAPVPQTAAPEATNSDSPDPDTLISESPATGDDAAGTPAARPTAPARKRGRKPAIEQAAMPRTPEGPPN